MTSLVLTLIGADRPGLVELLAETVATHEGNWLESRMSRLAGQFAGILRAEVPAGNADALAAALRALEPHGLRIVVERSDVVLEVAELRLLELGLVGSDRPGIIREISQALAVRGVNVDELHTERRIAPMSGDLLFNATARLRAPANLALEELRAELEKISADLMVDVALADPSDR